MRSSSITKYEKAFFGILDDIKVYLPHVVLVGGWVPYLYSKYLWRNLTVFPVATLDVDIGMREIKGSWKGKTIFNKLSAMKYKLEPIYDKEPFPIIPVFVSKKSGFEMRVEFITSFYVSDDMVNRFLGREIAIHRIDEFEWLINQSIKIKILHEKKVIELNVPEPHIFIFHKGLTFLMREDEIKRAKDLYYLYYILRFCPEYEKLVRDIRELRREETFDIFIKNLEGVFNSEMSDGPLMIESVSGFDPYVSSIKKDSYLRFQKFIKDATG